MPQKSLTKDKSRLSKTVKQISHIQTELASNVSSGRADGLMQGPTSMGNPLACSALKILEIIRNVELKIQVNNIKKVFVERLSPLNNLKIEVRIIGVIWVIELKASVDSRSICQKGYLG